MTVDGRRAMIVLGDGVRGTARRTLPDLVGGVVAWLKGKAGALARFGGGGGEGDLVTVYSARTIEEAWIVRGRLVAHDVPAMIVDHSLSSVYGSALQMGVDVRVPRALADRAASILEDDAESVDQPPHQPDR